MRIKSGIIQILNDVHTLNLPWNHLKSGEPECNTGTLLAQKSPGVPGLREIFESKEKWKINIPIPDKASKLYDLGKTPNSSVISVRFLQDLS